ncbi:MAG: FAD-dependent oxidoreductase [Alphaproteobacteria bacterium]|nr:FAD-dependent oxidoreductase [Alphaproteobacteria bacterium]
MGDRGHVTVIGAGVVGVATALCLVRDGFDVTVIDRDGPGENCSFGNAGMICDATSAVPLPSSQVVRGLPRMLMDRKSSLHIRWSYLPALMPWLLVFMKSARAWERLHNARAFHALLDGAVASWDRLVDGTQGAALIRKRGLAIVYETERGFASAAAERAILRQLGAEFSELSGAEVRQSEPRLSDAVTAATFLPRVNHTVNPYRLTRAIADSVVAAGGVVETATVTGIEVSDGRVRTLRTTAGDRKVDRLVVSAGAWSGRLAKMLGIRVLLDTERGYHTVFHGTDSGLRLPLIHGEKGFGVNQMDEGLRLAGSVEMAGIDAPADYARADMLVERGRGLLRNFDPEPSAKITRWMGRRPTLPDYLPALGRVAGLVNTWFNFGHQHLGLTLAARSGEIMANLVAGRDPGLDLGAFRPDRFHR